jgi:hypothetical protein
MATKVVNFKMVKDHWNRDTRRWDSDEYVYVGRWNKTYQLPHSPWHNPFQMGAESERERVIELYRHYIEDRIEEGLDLEALRGKTLVCWCKTNGREVACHADVLKELLGEFD